MNLWYIKTRTIPRKINFTSVFTETCALQCWGVRGRDDLKNDFVNLEMLRVYRKRAQNGIVKKVKLNLRGSDGHKNTNVPEMPYPKTKS